MNELRECKVNPKVRSLDFPDIPEENLDAIRRVQSPGS